MCIAMKYCPQCGGMVDWKIPGGDTHRRHVCRDCATVHYQNPNIVAGCIAEWTDGRILLCRRSINPRDGYWTLPAGFLERGETLVEGAVRETLEEANARVRDLSLYTVLSLPHADQVFMVFRGKLCDLSFSPGEESREVALFAENAIPWHALAFSTIHHTLKYYFADSGSGCYTLHVADIRKGQHGDELCHYL